MGPEPAAVIAPEKLGCLLDALRVRGYRVLGPTVRDDHPGPGAFHRCVGAVRACGKSAPRSGLFPMFRGRCRPTL